MSKYIGEKGVFKAGIILHNRENWDAIDYILKANKAKKTPQAIADAAQQIFELGCKYAMLLQLQDSGRNRRR